MHTRRRISHRFARHVASIGAQKTKVRAIVSLLSFAAGANQSVSFAVSSDTARANYFDTSVKPFSRIDMLHLDLAVYQSGASVNSDGFVDWMIWKVIGGSPGIAGATPDGTGLTYVPVTFRTSRAAVPQLTSSGMPSIYHIVGDLKIPPRFRVMAPSDQLVITFKGGGGAGPTYSVNGTITYMFKV